MPVRPFSDIGHVMPKIDWEGMCTFSRRKLKCACTLLELVNMTSLPPHDQLPTKNAMFILFCLKT